MKCLRIGATIALLALAAVACGGDEEPGTTGTTPGTGCPAGAVCVDVGDNFFKPDAVTATVGTKIVWQWKGTQPHNVKATEGEDFRSGEPATSGTFEYTLDKAGAIKYLCEFHGAPMSGTITATA